MAIDVETEITIDRDPRILKALGKHNRLEVEGLRSPARTSTP